MFSYRKDLFLRLIELYKVTELASGQFRIHTQLGPIPAEASA